MEIVLRNLTNDQDMNLHLPMGERTLENILVPGHEYIIVDHDRTLNVSEYDSIREVNDFLLSCKDDYATDENTLEILSSNFLYGEVLEMVREGSFFLINFTEATEGWNFGNGGDINSEEDKGRILHENGMRFDWEKEHPITKEMEDYIKWDCLWNTAESNGWVSFSHKGNDYLVHR